MKAKIITNPVHHLLRMLQKCLVSQKVACPCLDGMNSTCSSEKLGKFFLKFSPFWSYFFIVKWNSFWNEYRAAVIFGLNALSGRIISSDGSAVGAWNSSNAESLMRYTVNKGYTIYGWELGKNKLGNNFCCKKTGIWDVIDKQEMNWVAMELGLELDLINMQLTQALSRTLCKTYTKALKLSQ